MSRSESNEEAVVDGNGTAVEAVHAQPQWCLLLSPPHCVVHQASRDSLIGTDENGEAEGGEDSLLMPEPVSAGPLLWSISRTLLGTSMNMSIGRLLSMLHVLMDGAQERRTPEMFFICLVNFVAIAIKFLNSAPTFISQELVVQYVSSSACQYCALFMIFLMYIVLQWHT